MTATTKKKMKAQPETVDTLEAKKYETTPVKLDNVRMLKGYKYLNPISRLISFESDKHRKTLKMINKRASNGVSQSFTAICNDGLDLILYLRGQIKREEVSDTVLELLNHSYIKNLKPNNKKQK